MNATGDTPRRTVSTPRRIFAMAALVGCLVLIVYLWQTTRFFLVPSRSMEPTLLPGDYIVATKTESYQRGDVVVFRNPDDEHDYLVKRIVGMPGDTVRVFGGAVFLNGRYASEPYRHSPINYVMEPYTVPEGEYFLLGDHSNASVDSHNWGATQAQQGEEEEMVEGEPRSIPHDRLLGRVTRVYLPWDRRREVLRYPLRGTVEIQASLSRSKPMYNDAA